MAVEEGTTEGKGFFARASVTAFVCTGDFWALTVDTSIGHLLAGGVGSTSSVKMFSALWSTTAIFLSAPPMSRVSHAGTNCPLCEDTVCSLASSGKTFRSKSVATRQIKSGLIT
jgi:hypothetical protein